MSPEERLLRDMEMDSLREQLAEALEQQKSMCLAFMAVVSQLGGRVVLYDDALHAVRTCDALRSVRNERDKSTEIWLERA